MNNNELLDFGKPIMGNYVDHDSVYLLSSLAVKSKKEIARAKNFVQSIEDLVFLKSEIARSGENFALIRVFINSMDSIKNGRAGPKLKYGQKLLEIFGDAADAGVKIETNVVGAASGWTSELAIFLGTPGMRNMLEHSYHYMIDPDSTNGTKKLSPAYCAFNCFCDNILLNNGRMISRLAPMTWNPEYNCAPKIVQELQDLRDKSNNAILAMKAVDKVNTK